MAGRPKARRPLLEYQQERDRERRNERRAYLAAIILAALLVGDDGPLTHRSAVRLCFRK